MIEYQNTKKAVKTDDEIKQAMMVYLVSIKVIILECRIE